MFHVNISDVDDEFLGFMGYSLVAEDDHFRLYRDHRGNDHIVDLGDPYLRVEDVNDAREIAARSGRAEIFVGPP